ncbi:hypothetical protein T11_6578 [Trichinella zimbabwensis]|uniref:Uncharacterized protein n=1 Tax=Trichinella zimbabwensis TaxID=268475 RepID=A0A0V1HE82_9BILA|nr:hypothetical protein T11_6578 [Trichinella zimbabwensis]
MQKYYCISPAQADTSPSNFVVQDLCICFSLARSPNNDASVCSTLQREPVDDDHAKFNRPFIKIKSVVRLTKQKPPSVHLIKRNSEILILASVLELDNWKLCKTVPAFYLMQQADPAGYSVAEKDEHGQPPAEAIATVYRLFEMGKFSNTETTTTTQRRRLQHVNGGKQADVWLNFIFQTTQCNCQRFLTA